MRILFCCTDTKAQPWLEGFRVAFPGAEVDIWSAGAPLADYAVVWTPPQQFIDEQAKLKGIFNIGAGVDALMKLRLPPGVPVVRLDEIIMFHRLAAEHMAPIVEIQVARVSKLLKDRKITINLSDQAKAWLGRVGYDPVYGARPLKRAIQRHLQDPLADMLLRGEVPDGSTVEIDEGDGALVLTVG